MQTTKLLQVTDDVLRDAAGIEGIPPLLGDQFHRVSQLRLTMDRANSRRLATRQHDPFRIGIVAQGRLGASFPVDRNPAVDRITAPRKLNRRLEQSVESHGSEVLQKSRPGIDSARHRHGVRREPFNRIVPVL